MKLMMVCSTCDGSSWVKGERCTDCTNGFTKPSQQILDDLECAEIERKLIEIEKGFVFSTGQGNKECNLVIFNAKNQTIVRWIKEDSKVKALRKAKEYLDGRGAE